MELVLDKVTVEFNRGTDRRVRALADITLKITEGESVALVGPSGAGKSTLLRLLAGLITPNSGRTTDLRELGGRVALAIQEPQRGFFAATVREEVAFGPENQDFGSAAVKERVEWALKAVGLPEEKWERSPFSLSGGEQRRVALASVLSMRPSFLLLDEPTAGLDGPGRSQLTEVLRKLPAIAGVSLVIASHEPDFLFPLTKRVLLLKKGAIAQDTTWGRLAEEPGALTALGLELPAVLRILKMLAERGAPVNPAQDSYAAALEELRKLKLREVE